MFPGTWRMLTFVDFLFLLRFHWMLACNHTNNVDEKQERTAKSVELCGATHSHPIVWLYLSE